MKFTATFKREKWTIEIGDGGTVRELRTEVATKAGVGVDQVVLISKGSRLADSGRLPPDGSRVMVLADAGSGTAPKAVAAKQPEPSAAESDKVEEASPPEGFHVVIRRRDRAKAFVECSQDDTWGSVRETIARTLEVDKGAVRILWKGRVQPDDETLSGTGLTRSGTKLMTLLTGDYYDAKDREQFVGDLKTDLKEAHGKAENLRTQFRKRLIDREGYLFNLSQIELDVERFRYSLKHGDDATTTMFGKETEKQLEDLEEFITRLKHEARDT